MDQNLVVFAFAHNYFGNYSQLKFSIYNLLMIKTYVAFLELQYLFDN